MISIFRKKTREEKINLRVENVLTELTSKIECEFTELETVQILNETRRRLSEIIENKEQKCISNITDNNQKIKELRQASEYLK